MINNKKDQVYYISKDNSYIREKNKINMIFVHDSMYYILKYVFYLRKQEYYINTAKKSKFKKMLALL